MRERLQKILSQAGICSRRTAETYLTEGRITVNGTPAKLGDQADLDTDTICVDGVPLARPDAHTYLLLYKPRGYVCTLSDERGRKTVADLVADCNARVWPVGRLDLDSEGLLLLTDDGALTNRLTHPSHNVDKVYLAWVQGEIRPGAECLRGMEQLDGEPIRRPKIKIVRETPEGGLLSVTIHEGKNRQVRRMCGAAHLHVTRLKRIQEGPLQLGELRPGQWRPLTAEELRMLNIGTD